MHDDHTCSDPNCPGRHEKDKKGPYRASQWLTLDDHVKNLEERVSELESDYDEVTDCAKCNRLSWFQAFLFIMLFMLVYYFAGPLSEFCYMWIGENSYMGIP